MEETKKLLQQYIKAKREEDAVKACRIALGVGLASRLAHPEEGSKVHTIDEYKVTVGQRINRKVDWDEFDAAKVQHPKNHAPEKMERKLDIKGLHWVQKNEPEFYKALAKAITAKPGIPSITIKEIEDK